MARAFIGYDNVVDRTGVTITDPSALSTLPAENLTNEDVVRVWRTSGNSTVLQIDASSAVAAAAVAVMGHNFTSSLSFRVRASNTEVGSAEVLDETTLSPGLDTTYKSLLHVFSTEVTSARYWQVDLSDPGVTRLEAGRLFLAPVVRPAVSLQTPISYLPRDLSVRSETLGGNLRILVRPQRRRAQFQWEALTEAELYSDLFKTTLRRAGQARQVVFVPDEDSAHLHMQMILGWLTLFPAQHPTIGQYVQRLEIEEAL